MSDHQNILGRIDARRQEMADLAVRFASINSHTFNLKGLADMADEIAKAFSDLGEPIERIKTPSFARVDDNGKREEIALGDVLIVKKRPKASKQALLVCHMDTVYPADHSFQEIRIIDKNSINGPGITDAKGGIVVMLMALQALEEDANAGNIGWTVIINSDEEIGSPSSARLLEERAKQCQLGLVFEPCHDNGHLVGARKGSGNFALIAKGKAAHAGRNIEEGKNAIDALAGCLPSINALSAEKEGLTVNVGTFKGGSAQNVVAERAIAKINFRFKGENDEDYVAHAIAKIAKDQSEKTGVDIAIEGFYATKPKPLTDLSLKAFKHIQKCGADLGLDIQWEDSGGVCDGNRLQAAGLPTVDTMGACGGKIHSDEEYLLVDSLAERSKLAALALIKWANDEWSI